MRLLGEERGIAPHPPKTRIEEMFPEIPGEVEHILFDITGEPLFPEKSD